MAEVKKIVEELMRQQESLAGQKSQWKNLWQDIRQLVRPEVDDFYSPAGTSQGQISTQKALDTTSCWALEQLAASLSSFLISPVDRWFELTLPGIPTKDLDKQSRIWLEKAADAIYAQYSRPQSSFNLAGHEGFLDIAGFGTGVVYQEYVPKIRGLYFCSIPLAVMTIDEDEYGKVNRVFRELWHTKYQMIQRFGADNCPKEVVDCQDASKLFSVVHAVVPRNDRDLASMMNTNMPFGSYWILKESKHLLAEGGYTSMPYHVARWSKRSGEKYGRSPAMTCLPDIRLLNAMEKTTLKAAQKIVDPPLMVPDDGFVMPINTTPGSLMFYTAGMEDRIAPLETKGRIDISEAKMMQKREHIARCFYIDYLLNGKKNTVEMTATEVNDRRQEQFRQMAPIVGRMQGEYLGPILGRSFDLLSASGIIPPPPLKLRGKNLAVEYLGAAAVSQYSSKLFNIQKFLSTMIPVVQISPDSIDIIDTDALAAATADLNNVTATIIRTPEEIQKIREARKAQQAQMQQLGQADVSSQIMERLANARSKGGAL